jgi:hypothetical protein
MSVERFFGDVLETEDIKEMLSYWLVSNTKCCSLGQFEYFTEELIVNEDDYYCSELRPEDESKQIQVKERDILMSIWVDKGSNFNLYDGDSIYIWYRGSHVKSLFAVIKEMIDNPSIVSNDNFRLFYGDFEFITEVYHECNEDEGGLPTRTQYNQHGEQTALIYDFYTPRVEAHGHAVTCN